MDLNPLADMVEKAKQQHFDAKIQDIQTDINELKGAIMSKPHFITFNIYRVINNQVLTKIPVSINSDQILYIVEDGNDSYVFIIGGIELHAAVSREEILKLIDGKQYIG